MSDKLPVAKPREVIRVLEKVGFKRIRQKGSYVVYQHPDGRWTTVPMHPGKSVGRGLLHKILRDAKLSVEEFNRLK